MNNILQKIVLKTWATEHDNFMNFSPGNFTLRNRPGPIDIISRVQQGFFVIAEVKKGSPSKGIIREDFHPGEIAAEYEKAGASAISVITESHFFYGSKKYLEIVKNTVMLPVLRKDFLLHPFQVYESFNLGADFLLLIAACLTDLELEEFYRLTLSLGMQALVEVHTLEELKRVIRLKPRLIGINNRDLNSFKVNLQTSLELKKHIPGDIFVISESGISSAEDLCLLRDAGFAGALIGEALVQSADPGAVLQDLLHTNARRAIKSFDQTFSKVWLPAGPPEAIKGESL